MFIFITVASLLSSLHQLKEENVDLKDSVDRYVQRRDHLLAVRARLMALNNLSVNFVSGSNNSAFPFYDKFSKKYFFLLQLLHCCHLCIS